MALALSAGLYGGVYLVLAPKAKEQTLRMTYGVDEEEYQAVLAEARKDLAVLAQAEEAMDSPQGREQVHRLWTTGSSLVSYLEKEPGNSPRPGSFSSIPGHRRPFAGAVPGLSEGGGALAGGGGPATAHPSRPCPCSTRPLKSSTTSCWPGSDGHSGGDRRAASGLGAGASAKGGDEMKAKWIGPAAPHRGGPWGPWAMCGSPSPPR